MILNSLIIRHKVATRDYPNIFPIAGYRDIVQAGFFKFQHCLINSALQSSGILDNWARYLMAHLKNQSVTILVIGLLSAIVDNVPLVAAVQGKYPLALYPTNQFFWEFLAYAT